MPTYRLLPRPQAYGHEIGVLLLDHVEVHPPGDTAHARSYEYPVLFKVVPGASAYRVTTGEAEVEAAVVGAARELAEAGVRGISSNCGFMLHYQEAVAEAVDVPVMLSSLLQLPMAAAVAGRRKRIGILTAFVDRLSPELLARAGLPARAKTAIASIEHSEEFRNSSETDLDTDRFGARLLEAVEALVDEHDDIGVLLLECALYTTYAKRLQDRFALPVFDFLSLIDHLYAIGHRRAF